jgi:hypothetical protein
MSGFLYPIDAESLAAVPVLEVKQAKHQRWCKEYIYLIVMVML